MNQSLGLPLVALSEDGELRASTEAIARGYGVQHKNVLALFEKYAEKFATLGTFAFETRRTAGTPVRFVLLNQPQSMFLLTLMRNTAKVVDFKLALTQEFLSMAERLHNRDLTMFEKRLRLEAKDQTSLAKASMGSKLMLVRRAEKPTIKKEIQALESEMNQRLFH